MFSRYPVRRSLVIPAVFFFALSLAFPTGGAAPPGPVQPPSFNFYFGNMHSHTSFSDGTGTPREAYRHARDQGDLDFLAITEHNHRDAGPTRGDRADGVLIANRPELYADLIREADRATEDGRFVAFYGQEFSSISRGNHTNILMANKVIRTENGDYRTVFTDQWMNEHGVEVIHLNHPWEGKRRSNSNRFLLLSELGSAEDENYGFDLFGSPEAFRRALDERAFLIELLNGPALRDADAEHGETFFGDAQPDWYIAYLNRGLHLAPTGNQDNHYRTWGTINENRTVVLAPELTRAALLQAMKERRVYATEDKGFRVTFTVNNHIMGSRRPPVQGVVTARVRVSDEDQSNSRFSVQLFYDRAPGGPPAAPVQTLTTNNNGTATFNHTPFNRRGYYFAVVAGLQGANRDFRAWTAPVWFE